MSWKRPSLVFLLLVSFSPFIYMYILTHTYTHTRTHTYRLHTHTHTTIYICIYILVVFLTAVRWWHDKTLASSSLYGCRLFFYIFVSLFSSFVSIYFFYFNFFFFDNSYIYIFRFKPSFVHSFLLLLISLWRFSKKNKMENTKNL